MYFLHQILNQYDKKKNKDKTEIFFLLAVETSPNYDYLVTCSYQFEWNSTSSIEIPSTLSYDLSWNMYMSREHFASVFLG